MANHSMNPSSAHVHALSLARWGSKDAQEPESNQNDSAHFAYDPNLNAKIVLWNGAVWKLDVDAIVNPTSESLTDDSDLSGEILKEAGKEIYVETNAASPCRTGDALATRSCRLPCKRIIHTVGPRYNEKYRIAAENALHSCYRNCMRVAKEERASTIAFPCIYRQKKSYPRSDAVHVALRTIRRFLEHYSNDFELIVLCMESKDDQNLYKEWLPVYFPRSTAEALKGTSILDSMSNVNVGDAFGEPVIEERRIRISSWTYDYNDDDDDDNQAHIYQGMERASRDSLVTKEFCEMIASPDEERLEHIRKLNIKSKSPDRIVPTYQSYVEQGKHEDFEDIASLGLIYRAGVDHIGAPVLMVVGKNLPVHTIDLDRVLMYIIHVMDAVVERKYTVIYANAGVTDDNQPSTAWLKQLFKTFSSKYRENLKAIYILEASLYLKMTIWIIKAFVRSDFYAKIGYLNTRDDLKQIASSLKLPQDDDLSCPRN